MTDSGIQRVSVSEMAASEALQIASEYASAESHQLKEREEKRSKLLAAAYLPLQTLIERDSRAVAAVQELETLLEEKQQAFIRNHENDSSRSFSEPLLDIDPQERIASFQPPWDFEWSQGVTYTDKTAGKFSASAFRVLDDADDVTIESGAGFGFAIQSLGPVMVHVGNFLPIDFSWTAWLYNALYARAWALARLIVWRDDGVIVLHRQGTLYDYLQVGGGGIEENASTTFNNVDMGSKEFQMEINRTYYVWHYMLVGAYKHGNAYAASHVNCSLPYVNVVPV